MKRYIFILEDQSVSTCDVIPFNYLKGIEGGKISIIDTEERKYLTNNDSWEPVVEV